MKFSAGNPHTSWLLALCGALVLIIVIEWSLPISADESIGPDKPADELLPEISGMSYRHPPIGHFSTILERPVFFSDRKLPAVAVAAPAAPPTPLRLKLVGVAIAADSRVAVLRNLTDNKLLQLIEGASHNDWNLDSVTADNATFTRGEQVAELSLEMATSRNAQR